MIDRGEPRRKNPEAKRFIQEGYRISFQLKCSWKWKSTATHIIYDLKSRNFNDLVSRGPAAEKCMLILMCLPDNVNSWVRCSEEQLEIQKCCYYFFPVGEPVKNGSSTKRIHIPRENLLDAPRLSRLLADEKARREEQFT